MSFTNPMRVLAPEEEEESPLPTDLESALAEILNLRRQLIRQNRDLAVGFERRCGLQKDIQELKEENRILLENNHSLGSNLSKIEHDYAHAVASYEDAIEAYDRMQDRAETAEAQLETAEAQLEMAARADDAWADARADALEQDKEKD